MICCFMNFHEKENAKDLEKHLDKEIQDAINFGCTVFISGKNYPEDKVFEERVKEAAKKYNIEAANIGRVCKGERKTCGGKRWEFIDV